MIAIAISGTATGSKALLYEFSKRGGRRAFRPTYKAHALCTDTGERFEFAVVRDTSPQVFGKLKDRYGKGGECPPCKNQSYQGKVREDGPVGFRIELSERGLRPSILLGQGKVKRTEVQIHFGAAASRGCFLVAGRRRDCRTGFERRMRAMLKHTETILVVVEPR